MRRWSVAHETLFRSVTCDGQGHDLGLERPAPALYRLKRGGRPPMRRPAHQETLSPRRVTLIQSRETLFGLDETLSSWTRRFFRRA